MAHWRPGVVIALAVASAADAQEQRTLSLRGSHDPASAAFLNASSSNRLYFQCAARVDTCGQCPPGVPCQKMHKGRHNTCCCHVPPGYRCIHVLPKGGGPCESVCCPEATPGHARAKICGTTSSAQCCSPGTHGQEHSCGYNLYSGPLQNGCCVNKRLPQDDQERVRCCKDTVGWNCEALRQDGNFRPCCTLGVPGYELYPTDNYCQLRAREDWTNATLACERYATATPTPTLTVPLQEGSEEPWYKRDWWIYAIAGVGLLASILVSLWCWCLSGRSRGSQGAGTYIKDPAARQKSMQWACYTLGKDMCWDCAHAPSKCKPQTVGLELPQGIAQTVFDDTIEVAEDYNTNGVEGFITGTSFALCSTVSLFARLARRTSRKVEPPVHVKEPMITRGLNRDGMNVLNGQTGEVHYQEGITVNVMGAAAATDDSPSPKQCPEFDRTSELKQCGSRSLSSESVCRVVPNTVIISVSQDAMIRIFIGRDFVPTGAADGQAVQINVEGNASHPISP